MKTIFISKTHLMRLIVALALAFGALGLPTGSARAVATITVTNDQDSGAGSLRQAIADAGKGNLINFAGDYTILLKNELVIDKNLTIDGVGYTATVSGDTDNDGIGNVSVFYINSEVTFNLKNLAVSKGRNGIVNDGTLNINNSTFSGNSASTSGGGLYNSGTATATLVNTIVNNNTGGNCSGTITDGGNNIDAGTTCGFSVSSSKSNTNPLLSALGSYGSHIQTFALLPGSPAIDAGDNTICTAAPVNSLDQRGVHRPQGVQCDIGAFESRGFTLAISGGNSQSAPVNTAFTNPLQVSVLPVSDGEPVDGGTVSFNSPASGASAVITGSPATVSSGQAHVSATANDTLGSYNVKASTRGVTSGVDFALQNICADITVTNANDTGDGSLRQAIADICPGGTITFADAFYYLKTTSQLVIDKNLTIDGIGHSVLVSGDIDDNGTGDVRVFYVNPDTTVNLNNLMIIKGRAVNGGCILNNGTLNIKNSLIDQCSVSQDGGGIINESSAVLTVTNSTISDNSAMNGGGFENIGTATFINSTFRGNYAVGVGVGIDNHNGILTITNSTFSGNHAGSSGGGITNYGGPLTIANSTFSGNSAAFGGGIYNNAATATLFNTIVANNTGGNCSGTITDGGNNIDAGTTCGFSVSSSKSNTNPLLGTLANNGGPTQTFALSPSSPAIDAGDDSTCAAAVGAPNYGAGGLDQRGITRPQGVHCDIGAFEVVNTPPTVSLSNITTALPEDTNTSSAIHVANITVTDDALGINTLGLSGADAALFEIAGSELRLKAGSALDFETHPTLNVTVEVDDSTISGGPEDTEAQIISVTDVNEAPSDIALSANIVAENQAINTAVGTLSTTDPDAGDTFTYSLVSGNGSTDNASFNISGSSLRTSAAFDYETKNSYSIRVRSTDAGSLYFEKAFTISVTNLNEAPAGTDKTIPVFEDTPYSFGAPDFGFTDPNDSPANTLQAVKITTLPAAGALKLSGEAVTAGLTIAAGSIPNLNFTPAANANGAGYTSFTFQVQDNGGTANGGVDLDQSANTITVDVYPVNDAPSFTKGADKSVLEGAGAQSFTTWATSISAGPADESEQTLTFEVTDNTNSGLFSAGPAISSAGTLTFTPAANANGSATITIVLHDNGGTGKGGVDTSAAQSFVITVVEPTLFTIYLPLIAH